MEKVGSDEENVAAVLVLPVSTPDVGLVPWLIGLRAPRLRVIVVNDGLDETIFTDFSVLAALPGVSVLRHAVCSGRGASLKAAFRVIAREYPEVGVVVASTGDVQHQFEDIQSIMEAGASIDGAMVVGVRRGLLNRSAGARFRKKVLDRVFKIRTRRRLRDLQAGLCAIPVDLMLEALTIRANGGEFELALLRRGVMHERKVVELPISTRCVENGGMMVWTDWLRSLLILLSRRERI